jgi:hypothetical protein
MTGLSAVTAVTGVASGRISTESYEDFWFNAAGYESPNQEYKQQESICRSLGMSYPCA